MKTLVIYDSVFGNTEKIARAIAESLGLHASVEILRAGDVTPEQLSGIDLLVIGSPTRGFRPTESVMNLLNRIRSKALSGIKVAAFDTRFKADEIESAGVRFIDHETRLTKMEVEFFTDEMAHELESRSASKSDVGEIKRLLERVDARVQAIDARTVRLETTMERNGK